MKIAVFPGSFDPVTLGHLDVITRGAPLFDKLIIAIGQNSTKNYTFTLEQRLQFLKESVAHLNNIEVTKYQGLTVDFCKQQHAQYLLRGLRNPIDFQFEEGIAQANKKMAGIESVFILTDPAHSFISSSIVRDIIKNKGNYEQFVPQAVRI